MPLQRFVKVRGKPGRPVANPFAIGNSPPRFAGKQLDPALDGEHKFLDRYRDVEEILPAHQHLLMAIKDGELEQLGLCEARDFEDAARKMAPVVAAKKKGDV